VNPARWAIPALLFGAALWLSSSPAPGYQPLPPWPPGLMAEAVSLWQRALGLTARNPAPAILVSRYQFEHLRPLRSWQDLERLREYVEWADRAEGVGFSGLEIDADTAPGDLILLRLPRTSVLAGGTLMADPAGFAVLAPPRSGRQRIPVAQVVSQVPLPTLPPGFPVRPVPVIRAVVVRSADIVDVYGEAFAGSRVLAFSSGGQARVLYAGPNQINLQVESLDRVAIEVDGLRSDWCEVSR